MRLPRRYALTLLLAAGCAPLAPSAPAEYATLPQAGRPLGAGDPTRAAILSSSYAFGRPATLQGNPADAARALGQLEYLTAELGSGGAWRDLDPLVSVELRQAREEARAALGFRREASAQVAVDALFGASEALRGNDRRAALAAIAPLAPAGGAEASLARLAALPPLPRAASATARARDGLNRRDNDRSRDDWEN
jgi:hypothetical protein